MRLPSLSVIIPSYNRPTSTLAAVRSVIEQDVECEIIAVDDASTGPDELAKLLAGEPRVRCVRRKTNGGAGAARNTGLSLASHDLVTFLDSDDWMLPGTLAPRLRHAVSAGFGDPEARVIHACGWLETGGKGRERYPRPAATRGDFFSACWFAPGSAILAPATLFRPPDGAFDEALRRLEDYELFARLAVGGLTLASQPIRGVAINTENSVRNDEVLIAAERIAEKFAVLRASGLIGVAEVRAARAYLDYERAAVFSRSGKSARALAALARSWLNKPRTSRFPGPGWDKSAGGGVSG
ncbi:glycosyltransferase [Hoeflea sp. G2-23]|uniref:Glycosyltransferase n=1 Tax=Hoeflea algicola TaxID=2983763 RepID=A0ABT3ZC52_9HYPH|nr:glycosyltransferase family 2 protein [Hoeflea algicola]MCY0149223.1 glycosyltransferase [Hoeflea algicola]